jgi:hypothetical protein
MVPPSSVSIPPIKSQFAIPVCNIHSMVFTQARDKISQIRRGFGRFNDFSGNTEEVCSARLAKPGSEFPFPRKSGV